MWNRPDPCRHRRQLRRLRPPASRTTTRALLTRAVGTWPMLRARATATSDTTPATVQQHFASLDFSVPQGNTGSITYSFAKSTKGGTADVYLDGQFKQTVNFASSNGSMQSPEFKPEYNVAFANLSAGAHKLEIKNLTGTVYLDRFTLVSSSSSAQPASGPGATSNQSGSAAAGQASSGSYSMPSNSQEVSILAVSSVNMPFKLLLVDPKGLTLQTADASAGVAVLNVPVSQSGVYVIKVVNLSLGPLQFTTTTTPTVRR